MKTIAIIAAGDFPRTAYPRHLISSADRIVCCDGALARYLRFAGLNGGVSSCDGAESRLPDAIVGDLDSLPTALKRRFADRIHHNPDQETNDLTKAMLFCLETMIGLPSPDEEWTIHILGATGRREDHSVGNMSLLMEYERQFSLSARGIYVDMVSDYTTMFALTGSSSFDCGAGRPVSIFSPDPTLRISARGLEWPTDSVVFDNWWKGTLNRASADTVSLTFSHPSLALIVLG